MFSSELHRSTRNVIIDVGVKTCAMNCLDSALRKQRSADAPYSALVAIKFGLTALLGLVAEDVSHYWPVQGFRRTVVENRQGDPRISLQSTSRRRTSTDRSKI